MKINHHFIKLNPFFKAPQLNNSLDSVEVADQRCAIGMCWHLLFPGGPCLLLAHLCPCLPGSAASHYSCSRPCVPPVFIPHPGHPSATFPHPSRDWLQPGHPASKPSKEPHKPTYLLVLAAKNLPCFKKMV